MAQHTIMLAVVVSDRQYIQIIKDQQKSGKYTVESYLRGIVMDTLEKPKAPKKPKVKVVAALDAPQPVKKSKKNGVSAAEVMASLKPDTGGPEAEFAPSPTQA